jgi:D-sedoheptulose 7-phosphate isomerase
MSSVLSQFSEKNASYVSELASVLNGGDLPDLTAATARLHEAFQAGQKVFIAGNGGSSATASHMACDFQKTTLGKSHDQLSNRIRAIALSDNGPLISAWGNDVGYDLIFAQQLRNLGDPGDVLLVITASGNSPNILAALEAAKEIGITTIGFLGFQGGKAKALCDIAVIAPSSNYGVIEDAHSIFMHLATAELREIVHGQIS